MNDTGKGVHDTMSSGSLSIVYRIVTISSSSLQPDDTIIFQYRDDIVSYRITKRR